MGLARAVCVPRQLREIAGLRYAARSVLGSAVPTPNTCRTELVMVREPGGSRGADLRRRRTDIDRDGIPGDALERALREVANERVFVRARRHDHGDRIAALQLAEHRDRD